ncbi:MAG: dihydroxyacetone kinase subunit L [Ferrimicrobium sp.]|nr:dihydroxyacetone kinase subunit L [Ferrimicrobium sp.]
MDDTTFRQLWRRFAALVHEHRGELNDLDAAIGDGDHGSNMDRGLAKVVDAFDASPEGGLRSDAKLVGMTLMSTVGGASGALWGSAMLKFGASLPDESEVSWAGFVQALADFVAALATRGGAVVGDKTMMDVFIPVTEGLVASSAEDQTALTQALEQARQASDATSALVAKRGRAAYLGERSVGHVDPGSRSSALWFQALLESQATVSA